MIGFLDPALQPEAIVLGLAVIGRAVFARGRWLRRSHSPRAADGSAVVPPAPERTLVDARTFAAARERALARRDEAALDAADLMRMDSDAG